MELNAHVETSRVVDHCVVLLGASNMTLGFPWIIGWLTAALRDEADVFAAFGLGRSYGVKSRVMGRTLSSISDCALWTALDRSPRRRITAFICDIGNDILYGAEPAVIENWVQRDIDRLIDRKADIAIMSLPVATVTQLSPALFTLFRSVFYPRRFLSQKEVNERVRDLDARVQSIARSRGITLVTPRADWYGLDPIHFRAKARATAWGTFLGTLLPLDQQPVRQQRRAAPWRLAPDERRILGFLQRRLQPSLVLGNLKISLF
jgi:hypothetical protein